MASWGGKSAAQLLRFLDYQLFRTARKPICAFSDGCVILNAVTAMTGLVTFYGPNVVGKLDESNYGDLCQFTQGSLHAGATISLQAQDTSILRGGIAEGVLVGGNLSSYVISVIGSRFAPPFSDCILFWESGPKSAQELDLLLTAVRNSAQYPTIRAMLIGDAPLTDDSKWRNRMLLEIVADVFSDCSFPILYAPIFGHRHLSNPAIPIGCPARLDTERAELTLTQTPLME
jgi:muramoyltetrapeptide carboxypeptidase